MLLGHNFIAKEFVRTESASTFLISITNKIYCAWSAPSKVIQIIHPVKKLTFGFQKPKG
jgi:hypothetical protein